MRAEGRTAEQRMAGIARAAHGVATRAQLEAEGVTRAEIETWVRNGSILRVFRGVYRVGHAAPSIEATYLAAVLACGEGAVLRGRAAGHLLRLFKGRPPAPEVLTTTERRVPGVQTCRSRAIDERDATTVRRIRVTTVPRTLVDLAAILSLDALARACHEAGVLYRTTPRDVNATLARRPNSPGAQRLRLVMGGDVKVTLSELERAFLRRLRAEALPQPVTNRVASACRVDCRWPAHALTVELDSYTFHNSRHSWDQDRRREREAYARGDQFRRYTWSDVFEDPRLMLAELRTLLTPR